MKQPYPPEIKAAALAAITAGQSVNSVARQFGIGRTTLSGWRNEAGITRSSDVGQEKKREIGEQVLGLLEEYIAALRVQIRVTQDEAWIKRQSASELAIFHGVLADKSIRLLAAFRPESEAEE